jgi:hypothetical protein
MIPWSKRNRSRFGAKTFYPMPPKVKEDKTFGLKNKNKSAKVKKFVEQVQQQQKQSQKKPDRAAAKKEEEKRQEELKMLFNTEIIQKVPFGVDPKTILCLNFKNKNCSKGAKCKFSHDINVNRKVEKPQIYSTMEEWSQKELEEAVQQKESGNSNRNRQTDIVCKFFLDAIENQKYGWFWVCENGDNCKYRHMLPPGFVLKKKVLNFDDRKPSKSAENGNRERRKTSCR